MAPFNPRVHRTKIVIALSIVAVAASFFILTGSVRAQVSGGHSVTDVDSCSSTNVNIVRTPFQVRRQEQLVAGTGVLTLDGVFADLAPGVTFHVTHVSGQFFSTGGQTFHVRLYRNATIIEGFNVTGAGFKMDNSTISVRTLNQPVDLNFDIASDPGEYDMQIVRSGTNNVATGVVEFWGYLTSDTCPVRGQ